MTTGTGGTGVFVRFSLWYGGIAIVMLAAWAVAATWAAPQFIAAIYEGTGIHFLDSLLAGPQEVPLEEYQSHWRELRKTVSSILVTITLIGFLIGSLIVAGSRPRQDAASETDRTGISRTVLSVIGASVGIGLLTGYLEAYFVAVRAFYLGEVVPDLRIVSGDSPWMIPLVHAAVTAGIGSVVGYVGSRRLDRQTALGAGAGIACFIGLLSVLMATGWIAWWAASLLSAGVGFHVAGICRRRALDAERLFRRGVPALLLLSLCAAVLLPALRQVRERTALESLPSHTPNVPNVLLIVLDTERSANQSLYGYDRPTTPALEALAGNSVVFDLAISPGTWTLPSHASMFTGHFNDQYSLDPSFETAHPVLAESLADRGYATAGFVGNIVFCSDFYGLDRGFAVWRDQPRSLRMAMSSSWMSRAAWEWVAARRGDHRLLVRKTAEDVNREFLEWLPNADGRPWFAFLNYFDAHAPYYPPSPFDTLFADAGTGRYWIGDGGADASDYTARELGELRDRYDNGIAYVDARLSDLLDSLRSRGELDDTVVIVTSDHGELFGEDGWVGHGPGLHRNLVHVPLLIRPPGASRQGLRVRQPVSLRDLPSTVLALVDSSGPSVFPGSSLTRYWSREATSVATPSRDTVVAQSGGARFVFTNRFSYTYDPRNGSERLFDIVEDPGQDLDLADTPDGREMTARFRAYLRSHQLFIPPVVDGPGVDVREPLPWN